MSDKPADYGMYVVDRWRSPVGSGVTGATYCSIAGVAKTNTTDQPFLVANEFICNRLALMLGLPTPPGVITRSDDGQPLFLMLRFGRKGERFPPVKPTDVVNDHPNHAAGVIAFDVWVANQDRHSGNLLYVKSVVPLAMIDHGNALFGSDSSGTSRLGERRDMPCVSATSCLTEHICTLGDLERWSSRIARVDDDGIEDICNVAANYGGLSRTQAADACEFLKYRKDKVYEFVLKSRARFPKVEQWGLT